MKKLNIYKALTDERLSEYVFLDDRGRSDADRIYLARYAEYKCRGIFVTLGDTDFDSSTEIDAYIVDFSKLTKSFKYFVENYYRRNETEISLASVLDNLKVTRAVRIHFNEIKSTKQLIGIIKRNFNTLCKFEEQLAEYTLLSKIEKL